LLWIIPMILGENFLRSLTHAFPRAYSNPGRIARDYSDLASLPKGGWYRLTPPRRQDSKPDDAATSLRQNVYQNDTLMQESLRKNFRIPQLILISPACHARASLHLAPWYVNRIYPDCPNPISERSSELLRVKKPGDPDLTNEEACGLYDEWCAAGCPDGPL
jgi:hypothetical protein